MLSSSLSIAVTSAQFAERNTNIFFDNGSKNDDFPSQPAGNQFDSAQQNVPELGNPWLEPTLEERVAFGVEKVRVTVITWSLAELDDWQYKIGAKEEQAPAKGGQILEVTDPSNGEIDHRTFWLDSSFLVKLVGVAGVIAILDAENSPEPFDTTPFEMPDGMQPESVRTGEIHGANDAWERGFTGEGIVVAIADTGVDFGHPDLNGTQARVTDSRSDWSDWPMMFDHNSMYYWLVNGDAYPTRNTWYADTSTVDFDNDSNGVLDNSGHNISGLPTSISGEYHLGEHPDSNLRSKVGTDVPILVVDDEYTGVYRTVYADMDVDGNFTGEKAIKPGSETTGYDTDNDGLWDISGGLVYWVSDGRNGVPYAPTYSARHGYSNRIAGSGDLVLFMLESGSHGTLCASAVAAQGKIASGKVMGMAPNATIASIGNHYSGGHALDGWRWIAEGNDGKPQTAFDQPNIGSFSFGYSSIDDAGADGYSLYLDWLTRVYNNQTTYSVAIGNGGHGFGTTKVPGAANGVFSVGAFSSRSSGSWGQNAPWSNRGPNAIGRMDPDIVSVGWSATGDYPLNLRNNANSAYATWGGTSLATPITAGLLAVVAEAWVKNHGEIPKSQEFRNFVLSTADDRGYEPFVQGGGWFNASRAVNTLEGDNGTWSMSPAQWNSGTFQGEHRDANINYMFPGETQSVDLDFYNSGESDILLSFTPTNFNPIMHQTRTWMSLGNGSENGENDTWDGHQGDRPDLLIPLHLPNTTFALPEDTRQLRARATIDYAAFDGDMNRNSEERVYLEIYRWTDNDGDGIYVEDFDNDSMVDSDDWTESGEFDEVTYWWSNGPNAEVRVGNPFEDARDGLFLGVWNDYGENSDDPVSIEIDWTAFGSGSDDWLSLPSTIVSDANSTDTIQMQIDVPMDAESGLHQHGVLVKSYLIDENGSVAQVPHRNWTLPVVTNVPWSGPFTITPKPLDGNVSNQTLYDEEWISGATRWNWRAESGDWRFLTVDWPAEWATGGTVILDVDWDDNPYTDIDVLWLDETPHGYAADDPDAYGDSTFSITSRSTNNHVGSGRHSWGTYTGTSREVFTVPALAGTHQMILHTALHGVSTNDNPLNVSVGYVAAEEGGFQRYVTDWSEGEGVDAVHVVSTVPMEVESVRAYGWTQPIYLENETAYQDNSGDKMSASWWKNFTLDEVSELSISMNAHDDADLDLYLFRDDNENGEFESSEEIRRSISSTSSESINIDSPDDGFYAIAVLGWSVPSVTVQFWIDIDMIGGNELNITNQMTLSTTEINSIWPNGSLTLAGEVPQSAIQVNLAFLRPESAGIWMGHVEIELVGGISLKLPYEYVLAELAPEVDFIVPENLTHSNQILPVEIHALDTGIGFALDDLNWSPKNNLTTIPNADLVEAIDTDLNFHNLTSIWNSGNHFAMPENLSFREVWINSTVPAVEQWHEYKLNLTDRSGLVDEDWLSVNYDITTPLLALFGIPEFTQQQVLNYTIISEPNLIVYHDDIPILIDENGEGYYQFNLTQIMVAQPGSDSWDPHYYNWGNNLFEVSVTDRAGNNASIANRVIFDNQSSYIRMNGFGHLEFIDADLDPLEMPISLEQMAIGNNLSDGYVYFGTEGDVRTWCFSLLTQYNEVAYQQCGTNLLPNFDPPATSEDTPWGADGDFGPDISLNFTEIFNGIYEMRFNLTDWAGNIASQSWELLLDQTTPSVEWELSPASATELSDHRQGLSWTADESVHLRFTHNGIELAEWNGSAGGHFFDLNETGTHEFCIAAWDITEGQFNENHFLECRILTLNASIYQTSVTAPWDGGITTEDSVEAVGRRGPVQELWWWRVGDDSDKYLVPAGLEFVQLQFDLFEGTNDFVIEIHALDKIDSFSLSIIRDTTPPILSFYETINRTSPLETEKVLSGECESGVGVKIWSDIDSQTFLCDSSGEFELLLSVPEVPGMHLIQGVSSDQVNNQNSHSIEVLNQEWVDWAIDDAKNSGPMLWQFIGALGLGLLLIITPALASVSLKRRRRKRDEKSIEDSLDELSDILANSKSSDDQLGSSTAGDLESIEPLNWDEVNEEDFPEMKELSAWKARNESIYTIADKPKDDDTIDID